MSGVRVLHARFRRNPSGSLSLLLLHVFEQCVRQGVGVDAVGPCDNLPPDGLDAGFIVRLPGLMRFVGFHVSPPRCMPYRRIRLKDAAQLRLRTLLREAA
jgi:hypothetical protein